MVMLVLMSTSAPAMPASHCVILQYHHISDNTPTSTSVSPERFGQHLDYLATHNFSVLPLRRVVDAIRNNEALPDRCVSLTVDDAYASVYQNASPRLKKLGWPLTVFVNSEAVDQGLPAYMTWNQMRELASQGVMFENHGHRHMHMIRRRAGESDHDWEQRVVQDILQAQHRITDEIGTRPELFAYPYGEYNPAMLAIIIRMGLIGFGQQSGPIWPDAEIAALPRFPMAGKYASLQGFITKVNSLPLAVSKAEPSDPVLPLGQSRPKLTITLKPGSYSKAAIQCYIAGSNDVTMSWARDGTDVFAVSPNFDLPPGRHRTNCTMPSAEKGRFHWYSHNWFIRNADGSWYRE